MVENIVKMAVGFIMLTVVLIYGAWIIGTQSNSDDWNCSVYTNATLNQQCVDAYGLLSTSYGLIIFVPLIMAAAAIMMGIRLFR